MRCYTPNEGARLHSEPEKVGIQIYFKRRARLRVRGPGQQLCHQDFKSGSDHAGDGADVRGQEGDGGGMERVSLTHTHTLSSLLTRPPYTHTQITRGGFPHRKRSAQKGQLTHAVEQLRSFLLLRQRGSERQRDSGTRHACHKFIIF